MPSDAVVLACTHRVLRVCPSQRAQLVPRAAPRPPPTALHWFPTGRLAVSASPSSTLTFLSPPSLSPVGEIAPSPSSPARILSLSISVASRFLAVGRSDGVVSVLDLVTNAPMFSFTLSAPVVSVAFQRSPDARYLACATSQAVSLFSRSSNRLVARFAVASSPRASSFSSSRESRPPTAATASKITNVAFSPAHLNLLVASDESGCLNVWNVAKNLAPRARTEPKVNAVSEQQATYARFSSPFRAPAAALSFAPPGGKLSLCVGGFDKQLRFFDPNLKKLLFSVSCAAPVSAVSFASDGEHVAVGLTNGKMQVFRIDADRGTGKIISEVVVDDEEEGEPTAVRSVHFQPMGAAQETNEKGLKTSLQNAKTKGERPFSLAGIASRASPMKRRDATAKESADSDGSDVNLSGLDDDEVEYVDSFGDGLDVVTNAGRDFPSGMLRSAAGPRDSDIFSPVVSRTPKRPVAGVNEVAKASSFHETPRTVERSANITFQTPRSRSIQALTPIAERRGHSTDHVPGTRIPDNANGPAGGVIAEMDQIDSDSLDSISGKSSPKARSVFPTPRDVSQLQGSTFSDDVGHAFSDEREENTSRESDRATLHSPPSRLQNEMPSSLEVGDKHTSANFLRSVSQNADLTSGAGRCILPRQSSVPEKMTRPVASVTFESPGKKLMTKGSESASDTGAQYLGHSSNAGGVEDLPGHQLPLSVPGAASKVDLQSLPEKANWMAGIGEQLREVMRQELEVVKAELRSDVLNIHSEMVVISARQSQELKAAFVERDRRVKQLETEVRRLQGDNERLRRKYALL